MSFPATRMRAKGAPKITVTASFVRCRSTAGGASSMLEAKSRVREYARNISRSTTQNATAAPSVYAFFEMSRDQLFVTRIFV